MHSTAFSTRLSMVSKLLMWSLSHAVYWTLVQESEYTVCTSTTSGVRTLPVQTALKLCTQQRCRKNRMNCLNLVSLDPTHLALVQRQAAAKHNLTALTAVGSSSRRAPFPYGLQAKDSTTQLRQLRSSWGGARNQRCLWQMLL